MIIYKEVFEKLKEAGYSTARIRKEKLIPEGTMQNIRQCKMVSLGTVDTLCRLTGLKVEDFIEYVKD